MSIISAVRRNLYIEEIEGRGRLLFYRVEVAIIVVPPRWLFDQATGFVPDQVFYGQGIFVVWDRGWPKNRFFQVFFPSRVVDLVQLFLHQLGIWEVVTPHKKSSGPLIPVLGWPCYGVEGVDGGGVEPTGGHVHHPHGRSGTAPSLPFNRPDYDMLAFWALISMPSEGFLCWVRLCVRSGISRVSPKLNRSDCDMLAFFAEQKVGPFCVSVPPSEGVDGGHT